MTEPRLNEGFTPWPAHRPLTQADAAVFADASHMLSEHDLAAAIRAAGGDSAHLAYLSRTVCNGRPVAGWAQDKDEAAIRDALVSVAEALAG